MDNNNFNLMNQLIQEQKSLWRIERHYIQEAQNEEEEKFWEQMKNDKQEYINTLKTMVKQGLN